MPYVPTRRYQIPRAFELLRINEKDKIIDLGCGNGQFLTYGAKRVGADFVGIELNVVLYTIARINKLLTRRKGTITIKHGNFFSEDLSKYSKIFMFHMPTQIKNILPKLEKELQKGAKVVSIVFPIESPKLRLLKEEGDKYKLFLYERVN